MLVIHIVTLSGFFALAMAMGRKSHAAASLRIRLRTMGATLLIASLILSVAGHGLSIGIVTWFGAAMMATVAVAFSQTWLKAWTR